VYQKALIYLHLGTQPSQGESFYRAHKSLPQPLHLKAVFTDHKNRKASIRFEFVSYKSIGSDAIQILYREILQLLFIPMKSHGVGMVPCLPIALQMM